MEARRGKREDKRGRKVKGEEERRVHTLLAFVHVHLLIA